MKYNIIDLTGKVFGKRKVIKYAGRNKWNNILWLCRCSCGKGQIVEGSKLKLGKCTQCNGCAKTKHGMGYTKEYHIWCNLIVRCYNPDCRDYKYYGGRNIKVCKRWLYSFENFFKDMGYRPKGLTLERIGNDGNYTPKNCKWATWSEQNKNKRRFMFKFTDEIIEKVRTFADLLEEQQLEQLKMDYPEGYEVLLNSHKVNVKYGEKYIRVDVGGSGKYMVDGDGNIYGIKGYGVINKKKQYGTLDTSNNFWWGKFRATRKIE
jgi:hypothetical protein